MGFAVVLYLFIGFLIVAFLMSADERRMHWADITLWALGWPLLLFYAIFSEDEPDEHS